MNSDLWSNYLVDKIVTSDGSDKFVRYEYSKKLGQNSRRSGVAPFLEGQDTTDAEFNVSDMELPEGMESTDELMAANRRWIEAQNAVEMIEALLDTIENENIRFSVLTNSSDMVVEDLKESLIFAKEAASKSGKFNFAVIT